MSQAQLDHKRRIDEIKEKRRKRACACAAEEDTIVGTRKRRWLYIGLLLQRSRDSPVHRLDSKEEVRHRLDSREEMQEEGVRLRRRGAPTVRIRKERWPPRGLTRTCCTEWRLFSFTFLGV